MLFLGKSYFIIKGYASHGDAKIVKKWRQQFAFFTRNPRGGNAKAIDLP